MVVFQSKFGWKLLAQFWASSFLLTGLLFWGFMVHLAVLGNYYWILFFHDLQFLPFYFNKNLLVRKPIFSLYYAFFVTLEWYCWQFYFIFLFTDGALKLQRAQFEIIFIENVSKNANYLCFLFKYYYNKFIFFIYQYFIVFSKFPNMETLLLKHKHFNF